MHFSIYYKHSTAGPSLLATGPISDAGDWATAAGLLARLNEHYPGAWLEVEA